jgi:predicted amidohydrolase
MANWKIAAVQMNCRRGERQHNLHQMKLHLRSAARHGARLIAFPECILTGYAFDSLKEAMPHAEPLPGPSTEDLHLHCRELETHIIYGLLERDGDKLFNACALVGPDGLVATYRKVHLPHLGVDRFATPGDRPFAVHELGGLKVGMTICFDGSFPEASRVLALLGADLIVLPTNWPTAAACNPQFVVNTRALENHVYYAAVNRVGQEGDVTFIGQSKIAGPRGETLAASHGDKEEILYAEVEPAIARQKRIVHAAGKYEIDRIAMRRPEFYQPLVSSQ